MEKIYSENRKRRVSNRRYPPKACKKPDCNESFIPHDAKQKYCCEQHRIDHNNDLQKERNKELKEFNSKLLNNEAILKKMYLALQRVKRTTINMSLFEYEGFDFHCYSKQEVNVETKQPIYWCLNFGIEGKESQGQTFIIHKKDNYEFTNKNVDNK